LGARAADIEASGAELVAIANTASFSQMAFAARLGIDFPLLSDWGGETAAAYGVRYDAWKGHRGLAKRSIFVVDGAGTIAYRWVTDDAHVLPPLDEMIDALRSIAD
jgi:peroxiredoxin